MPQSQQLVQRSAGSGSRLTASDTSRTSIDLAQPVALVKKIINPSRVLIKLTSVPISELAEQPVSRVDGGDALAGHLLFQDFQYNTEQYSTGSWENSPSSFRRRAWKELNSATTRNIISCCTPISTPTLENNIPLNDGALTGAIGSS